MKRSEKERLERIRQAQLSVRNPVDSKIRGYDWAKQSAKPKPKPKLLLIELYSILPPLWKGVWGSISCAIPLAIIPFLTLDY